jgi:hypothetical protein
MTFTPLPASVRRAIRTLAVVFATVAAPSLVVAQTVTVELGPVGGYRVGGGFFEQITGQEVDLDGAPSVGGYLNVRLDEDLFLEIFATHQEANVTVPATASSPETRWDMTVDHWMAGGLREFGAYRRRARPFLTGLLGLTRYATEGDTEIRFTASAGGGVKLMPTPRIGIRLDGRVFGTFVDAEGRAIACTPGICLVGFEADFVWQGEATIGLVIGF